MKKGVDYIGVGVGAVIEKDGKYFLAKRGAEANNEADKWEFPGGGVEFGETVEDTVVREIKEEHGIEVRIVKLLDYQNHMIPEEKQHWFTVAFLCEHVSGEPKIMEPHKCAEIGWFSLEEIKNMDLSIATQLDFKSLQQLE